MYEHMNIKYLQIVVISSFSHLVRRSLENIFLLSICRKHFLTIQLLYNYLLSALSFYFTSYQS